MGFTFKLDRSRFSKWHKQDNPGGILTFVHEGSESALQFTYRKYTGPKTLDLSPPKLIQLATNGIEKVRDPKQRLCASGECDFGNFGTIVLKGGVPVHFQAWVLASNRAEIIYVTYICSVEPDAQEALEAHQMAMRTSFE
jgi:hypothetical protein